MPSLEIRLAVPSDLDSLAPLFDDYRQFYEQPPDPTRARRFIGARLERGDAVLLIALRPDGAACGFAQLYPSFCSIRAARIYTLSDLYVRPNARRDGVGRALLRAAAQHAAATGRVRLELTTARTNHVAQATYAALGWQRDEVFLTYTLDVEAA